MKKSRMIRKIGSVLFLLMIVAVLSGKNSYAKENNTYLDVGTYADTENGYSYPGVAFYMDGVIQHYAMDIWKKTQEQWSYCHTRVNDRVFTNSDNTEVVKDIRMKAKEDGSHSFTLSDNAITPSDEYSVLVKRIQAGKKREEVIEYSDDPASWQPLSDYSFCNAKAKKNGLDLTIQDANSSSFIYRIYNAKEVAPDCNGFQFDLAGGTLEESGKAYYDGENYVIRKLPKVSKSLKGYAVTFDGWYDAKNGGNPITVGSIAYYGQTLYAHWTQRAYQYKVHYVDLLKEKADDVQFLSHREKNIAYGSYASGADIGDSKEDGAYYTGYTLDSTTKEKVIKENITVYRYFIKSTYQVRYIDQVIEGKKSGTILQSVKKVKEYQEIANGAELGTDTKKHKYYKGYQLSNTTSVLVDSNAVCVYRYFVPVRYSIHFDGMEPSNGIMRDIESCEYLESITLPKNVYQKKIQLRLHLNCEDAICDSNESVHPAVFLGWSQTAGGDVEFMDQAQVAELCDTEQEEVTLYAIWDYSNQKITNIPTRQGYQFAGWSQDPDVQQGNTTFQWKEDMDLYAVWKACNVPYHVEYYKEKTDGTYEKTAQYEFTGKTDSEVSIEENAEIYPGFYLDRDASVLKGKVRADGSLILAAYYSRNVYTLTMDVNGGKSSADLQAFCTKTKYGTAYAIPNCDATRYGYRFAGWSTEKENYHRVYQSGETILMPNHDTVLYAAWEPIEYTVHFKENLPEECKEQSQKKMRDQKIGYDQETILSECIYQAKGYAFAGWSLTKDGSEALYSKEDIVKNLTTKEGGEVTLYAIWKPLSFKIHYEKGRTPHAQDATGEIDDTQYFYDKDCFAAKSHFAVQGYHIAFWNTKEDGSGISVLPGENLKGKYIANEDLTLYAVWKANEDTPFTIELRIGNEETYEVVEMKKLNGETEKSIAKALEKCYSQTLDGEEAAFFYSGYEIINKEVLEQKIKADGSSYQICFIKRRDCKINYYQEENGKEKIVCSITYPYETTVTLKDSVEDITGVERYVDDKGKIYAVGEKMTLWKNANLHIQHSISFEGDHKKYVDHGACVYLENLKKEGHRLEGWYEDAAFKQFAGMAGQRSKAIYKNMVYYPKWSDPLNYKITYDLQNTKAVMLENRIDHYVYGQKTQLPDASQLFLPDGYQFVGWFDVSDPAMTILTEIGERQTGDKVLRLLLMLEEKKTQTQEEKKAGQSFATVKEDRINNLSTGEQNASLEGMMELQTGKKSSVLQFKQKGITYCVNEATRELVVSTIKVNKKNIKIPRTVTWKQKRYKVIGIKEKALYRHKKVQEFVIADTITSIDAKAILQNPHLKKITIGRNVSKIEKDNLRNCPKLKKILFKGDQIKKIGKNFCISASKVTVYGKKEQKKLHLTKLRKANHKVKWRYRSL